MNLTAHNLARRIVEDVTYPAGPCIYPGGFKPPHKGHFEVAKDLSTRSYITEVYVVISTKPRDGITAEQSLKAWQTYLECEPNPKINVEISPYPSPVLYAWKFIEARPEEKVVYIVGGKDEVESQNYFTSLQKRFGDQVMTIAMEEKFGRVSATTMRQALRTGNYDLFKELVPDAVSNKGKAPELFKSLAATIKEDIQPQPSKEECIKDFLLDCYSLLEIDQVPEIETITDPEYARQMRSFGSYMPGESKITVYINNRNLADILRTLAHELVHHKQCELGMLQNNSGDTGSEIENEANAVAAMIMREYGKRNPNIYE